MNKIMDDVTKLTKRAGASLSQAGVDLKQITNDIITNGCSAVPEFNMHECCDQHDVDYRIKNKFRADWNLFTCGWKKANTYEKIYKRTSTRFLSFCFWVGVSVGGWGPYMNAQKEFKLAVEMAKNYNLTDKETEDA